MGGGGIGEGNFPLASVGSRAGGDNRKRARSAQRRVGQKIWFKIGFKRVLVYFPNNATSKRVYYILSIANY